MTSTLKSAELPLEPGTEANSTAKFTEDQAREWLTANPKTGTVREIAAAWGWSKSTTQRFLSHGTSLGQGANFGETGGTSGTADETLSSGAAMPAASVVDDDYGPPIGTAPYSDDFDWAKDESVVVPAQPAIAVYINSRDQVVIRAEGGDYDEDSFVVVSPEHLPALIAKLTAILKESTGSGGAR